MWAWRWPFASQEKKPGRDLFLTTLRSNQPCWYLNCGLLTSQTWDNKSLLFKPLSLWCFVRVALGNQHTAIKSLFSPFPSSMHWKEVIMCSPDLSSTSLRGEYLHKLLGILMHDWNNACFSHLFIVCFPQPDSNSQGHGFHLSGSLPNPST